MLQLNSRFDDYTKNAFLRTRQLSDSVIFSNSFPQFAFLLKCHFDLLSARYIRWKISSRWPARLPALEYEIYSGAPTQWELNAVPYYLFSQARGFSTDPPAVAFSHCHITSKQDRWQRPGISWGFECLRKGRAARDGQNKTFQTQMSIYWCTAWVTLILLDVIKIVSLGREEKAALKPITFSIN